MPVLSTSEGDLSYQLAGRGAPVLLIQGVGVPGDGWLPQVEAMEAEFQTLRFDHRGLGRSTLGPGPLTIESMAADARRLLDAVGWPSAHVVGHSMGGVIAQQLALDAPDRIRSLSLLCTVSRGIEAAKPSLRVLWLGLRSRIGTRGMRRRAFLRLLVPRHRLREVGARELAEQFSSLFGRDLAQPPAVVKQQLRALKTHDASGRLGELKDLPTLVLSAEFDPIAPPKYGRRLAELVPGARFRVLADASHGITIERPDVVHGRLFPFLRLAGR